MLDVLYIVIFLACCAATGGLAAMCDRLKPSESARPTGSKP